MSEAKLKALTVKELKDILTKAGLPVSGKKDELISRLLENPTAIASLGADEDPLAGPDDFPDFDAEPAPVVESAPPSIEQVTTAAAEPTLAPSTPAIPAAAIDGKPTLTTAPASSIPEVSLDDKFAQEEAKRKARAAKFGIEFKPAPPPSAAKSATPAPAPKKVAPVAAKKAAEKTVPEKKVSEKEVEKKAIDPEEAERRAKRAARFGSASEPAEKKTKV